MKLEEFPDESHVRYAILSHRWEGKEVSFNDVLDRCPSPEKATSYAKIQGCCNQARKDELTYVWIDTCCIDKRSSAELQEAINSMYRWYAKAVVCYVYLSDVRASVSKGNNHTELSGSAWFTRGWTLQELLAPSNIVFFEQTWNAFGTREELAEKLSEVTGIEEDILQHGFTTFQKSGTKVPTCTIMSWACGRQTTRIEDRSYSMLGLFNVNMPMLYGEGEKAFVRLQEEIIRVTDDQTVFAWAGTDDVPAGPGCFAASPDQYVSFERRLVPEPMPGLVRAFLGSEWKRLELSMWHQSSQLALTNQGISMHVQLLPVRPFVYLALLNMCMSPPIEWHGRSQSEAAGCGIFLTPLEGERQFARLSNEPWGVWQAYFREIEFDPNDRGLIEEVTIVRNVRTEDLDRLNPQSAPNWGSQARNAPGIFGWENLGSR